MSNIGITPLIEKYSEAFEKDQTSKVFAPLAEGYRRAGLLDRAFEILKIGIRNNPTYLQGYISLANCYFDVGEFNLSYTTIRPLVADNRDNIKLQKLFASSCLELGHSGEALESYKYLLFLNPKDTEVSTLVSKLENEGSPAPMGILNPIKLDKFEIDDIEVRPEVVKSSLDEWIKVDLKKTKSVPVEEKQELSDWDMKSVSSVVELKPIPFEEVKKEEVKREVEPVITHSLVDLYINQGHLYKAKELLNKILELNPGEASSLDKLREVEQIEMSSRIEVDDEEDGHQRLMDSLDAKLGSSLQPDDPIKNLQKFLDAIQKHSENRKDSRL